MKTVILKLLFYVCAGVGLIFQLKDVVRDYFAYKTSSKVELLRKTDTDNPAIVFCVRFSDILNRSNYTKYGIHPKRHNNSNLIQHELASLTVEDIFNLTPDAKDVIEKCEYRYNSYRTIKHSKSECSKLIKVAKYVSALDVCYQFMTTSINDNFDCSQISLSIYNRRKIFAVRLSDEFRGSHMISMISHYPDRDDDSYWWILPQEPRKFATSMLRLDDFDQNLTDHNSFRISHVHYQLQFMPPPYDTMCTTIPEKWKVDCEMICDAEIFGKYRRIPPDGMVMNPSHFKIFTEQEFMNKTMVDEITSERMRCHKDCIYEWCIDSFTVTEVTEAPTQFDSISLAAACSLSPTHKLIFYAKHSLDELLIYTTSSFGVWFGFCFVSLNPTSLVLKFKRMKRKMKRKRITKFQSKNTSVKTIRQPVKFKLCIPTPENQQQFVRPRDLTQPKDSSILGNFKRNRDPKSDK